MCGMNPRGIYKMWNFGEEEMINEDAEDFTATMHSLHEQVKQ